MSRMVRDARMETREARRRLAVQDEPHWRTLVPGSRAVHLGYRRRRSGAGSWVLRRYVGDQPGKSTKYVKETIGVADDSAEADGATILTFAEAQRIALERSRAPLMDTRRALTVEDAIRDYVASLNANGRSSRDAEGRARTHILPVLGRERVDRLTTRMLTNWRNGLVEAGPRVRTRAGAAPRHRPVPKDRDGLRARRATANRTLTVLKAALNAAFKSGVVSDDLAWRRVEAFERVGAARPGHLSVREAQRLIAAADEVSGFRALVRAALTTGCRYGELCRLQVGEFARGRLHVSESKSGRPRDVRLTDEGAAFFRALAANRPADEHMLLRGDGKPWGPSHQIRPMEAACTAAGLEPIGFHQLRHTYASLAIMNETSLLVVSRNLGHRDTRMVEKHYGHLTDDYLDDAIRRGAPRFDLGGENVVELVKRAGGAA